MEKRSCQMICALARTDALINSLPLGAPNHNSEQPCVAASKKIPRARAHSIFLFSSLPLSLPAHPFPFSFHATSYGRSASSGMGNHYIERPTFILTLNCTFHYSALRPSNLESINTYTMFIPASLVSSLIFQVSAVNDFSDSAKASALPSRSAMSPSTLAMRLPTVLRCSVIRCASAVFCF